MSVRQHFMNELAFAAESVAHANKIIAEQRRRIARLKCKGGNADHAEDLLEIMLDRRIICQDFHDQLLHALLTTTTRPVMPY